MADITRVFVKPVPGHRVRNPQTKQWLPESGGWVSIVDWPGRWWRRRIRDGAIVRATPPSKARSEPGFQTPKPDSNKRRRTKKED